MMGSLPEKRALTFEVELDVTHHAVVFSLVNNVNQERDLPVLEFLLRFVGSVIRPMSDGKSQRQKHSYFSKSSTSKKAMRSMSKVRTTS